MIRRLLIANRGEIAARIIRTCQRLGIEAVLGASEADLAGVPARLADQVVRLGPPPAAASYLNVDAVVAAARAVGRTRSTWAMGSCPRARVWPRRASGPGSCSSALPPNSSRWSATSSPLAGTRWTQASRSSPAARSAGRPRPGARRAVGLAGARQGGRRWRWPGNAPGNRAGGARGGTRTSGLRGRRRIRRRSALSRAVRDIRPPCGGAGPRRRGGRRASRRPGLLDPAALPEAGRGGSRSRSRRGATVAHAPGRCRLRPPAGLPRRRDGGVPRRSRYGARSTSSR